MARGGRCAAATILTAGLFMLTTTAAAASTFTSRTVAVACTAIDAPAGMTDLPASADCGFALGLRAGHGGQAVPATTSVAPTTKISGTPTAFDSTDGDILAITRVSGAATAELAIGGNFSNVKTPDGTLHAAKDFAVVSESTGAVLYAGHANSYVRAISSWAGILYVAGDFTTFGGVSRSHLAALSPTFAVTSWEPSANKTIRAIAADSTGVYYGGDVSSVIKVSLTGGAMWRKWTTRGDVHVLLLYDGALYVGGLFETYDGITQHGLVKVTTGTGSLITAFNAHLRADTGVGTYGQYDGEEAIALTRGVTAATLVVGTGGHAPPHMGSNQAYYLDATTGSTHWRTHTIGDAQGVGLVGDTVVAGYHRNVPNTTTPFPYFCTQLEVSNGVLTTWDPKITGDQSNADGGNNGVQAIYADPVTKTIFLAGAFTQWNGTSTHKSLIAFTWA